MKLLRAIWKEESEKLKKLDQKARAKYIWDYYKIPIIALACFVLFIGYIFNMMHDAISEHWLYVTYVNTTKELGTNSPIWKEYVAYTGYDLKEKKVEFNSDCYFNYLENKAQNNKYYEMLITYISAGTLDAVVMESEALVSLGESGWFLDLNSENCTALREKYSDRFLYSLPLDTEYSQEEVPVGIDISDSRLMSEYNIYLEGTGFGLAIGNMSQNQDAIMAFLEMILPEE